MKILTLIKITIFFIFTSSCTGYGEFTDADGDGFNAEFGDCNDNNPNVFPNAYDWLNGVDDNCNGLIDEFVQISPNTNTPHTCTPGSKLCTVGGQIYVCNDNGTNFEFNIQCEKNETCSPGYCLNNSINELDTDYSNNESLNNENNIDLFEESDIIEDSSEEADIPEETQCTEDEDCSIGFYCIQGQCFEIPDLDNNCDENCNGHGNCTNGICTCFQQYTGINCNECSSRFENYPDCTPISNNLCEDIDCNGHGNCINGICDCNIGYQGLNCDECSPSYSNYPNCTSLTELNTPELLSPEDNEIFMSQNEINFMWSSIQNASEYQIRISNNINFINEIICNDCLYEDTIHENNTNVISDILSQNQDLYWSVRSTNASQGINSDWAMPRILRLENNIPNCQIISDPPIDQWTLANPETSEFTDCICMEDVNPSCKAIYKGRVLEINENIATLEFAKQNNSGPNSAVNYWVSVLENSSAECHEVPSGYISRMSGTWFAGTSLTVDVPIWPQSPESETYEQAADGDTKKLIVISGGSNGLENERIWFQDQPIVFTKVCN
jgi:hypothetical protein